MLFALPSEAVLLQRNGQFAVAAPTSLFRVISLTSTKMCSNKHTTVITQRVSPL